MSGSHSEPGPPFGAASEVCQSPRDTSASHRLSRPRLADENCDWPGRAHGQCGSAVRYCESRRSAVLSSLTTSSTDKWGDEQSGYSAGSTIDVVPFLYVGNRLNYQPFGDIQESEIDLVIKYDVTLGVKDRIVFNGENYFITEIDNSAWFDNGLVVQIVRVRREA